METKTNLAKAIIEVMKAVKGIDKTMTIGTGQNSYKGVPDQEVKKIIGDAMAKNGLCILPIKVAPKTQIDRWDGVDYNGKPKMMQSVFTEVVSEYLLLHESGESQVLSGYGHGIDSQDKGAGKATTYALKYALLYTFLVPTGKIDDADSTHSDNIQTPHPIKQEGKKEMVWMTEAQFKSALNFSKSDLLKTLSIYNGQSGKSMKAEYLKELTAKLATL